jgi:hypothetical protein
VEVDIFSLLRFATQEAKNLEINLKNVICGLNINSGEIEQSKY